MNIDKENRYDLLQFNKDIRKHIDALNRKGNQRLAVYRKENNHHMTALKGGFQQQVQLLIEQTKSKPDETRVREIIQEEVATIKSDVCLIKTEVGVINKKLITMTDEMKRHNDEMKNLRLDVNGHDKRLTTVESMLL